MGTTTFTQANRLLSIDTPLGADRLLLRSFTGTEGISQLFQFQLDMLSEDFSVAFDRIVGQNVTASIRLADEVTERYFNGYISSFAQLPGEGRLAHYQATMVPWLWFLTRTSDCRIFQNKTVPDIIREVFQDFGFQDFEDQLQGNYEPWDYCVQYRETAFNFLSRLMEQEGIFYFFRHDQDRHVMVIADSSSAHRPCPNASRIRYEHVVGPGYAREEDVIFNWSREHEIRPGRYAHTDFNFQTPSTSLLANVESRIEEGGNRRYEIFDYPGEYLRRNQGEALVRLRMEEQELPHDVITGESNCRSFATGFRFDLAEHERRDQNGQYVLTSVTHSGHSGSFYSETAGEGASYANGFTCIPYAVPFRPPRLTPKPLVQGPQTAVVVGPGGEEIHTDRYGRVRVQFYWDRRGEHNAQSSCWIRVSQPWAGRNWGGIWLPRIGQEVIVEFLEGDPDRPIITGRVYNAENMPPYELPANQTQSGFKSRSSKGGGSGNFNEIRFEDKKGSEEVCIHAERNLSTVVEASESRSVGGSRSTTIQKNETLTIKEGNREETLQQGNDKLTLQMGNRECNILQGNDKLTLPVGNIEITAIAGKYTLVSKQVVVNGILDITLLCGGSTIKMTPAMITIASPMVKINC